jgi:predicted DNA-binding protein (UPF0251 family)
MPDQAKLVNLEWCSHAENTLHSFRVLGQVPARGMQNGRAKLTDEEVDAIRAASLAGHTQRSIAARFGISPGYVCKVARGDYRQ